MAAEKHGYALKVERGERPFIYSAEHGDWANAVRRNDRTATDRAAAVWARRFPMTPTKTDPAQRRLLWL